MKPLGSRIWCENRLRFIEHTSPKIDYEEARDEAFSLWKAGWMTTEDCQDIVTVLYRAKYLTVIRPLIRTSRSIP
jgi:hypothetical protein